MIIDELKDLLSNGLKSLDVETDDIKLSRPAREEYGDYSTNIALQLAGTEGFDRYHSPGEFASSLVRQIENNLSEQVDARFIKKIEIAGPGFINFHLSQTYLFETALKVLEDDFAFPDYHLGRNRKIIFEYAHPNTHKLFHIGHLRNIILGESLVRLYEAVGNEVIRANYQGDVGLHIAKCLYGVEQLEKDLEELETLEEKIEFLGDAYVAGNRAYEADDEAKQTVTRINKMIYQKDPEITPLLEKTRAWSLEYFARIYERVGTKFDRLYFESEVVKGREIARGALEDGILIEDQGAVIFPGEKYGLDRRVFITGNNLPTYEAKELALAELEFSEFGEIDRCIHVVGPEQKSFFEVTFKVEELLDQETYKDKQRHLVYGYVQLKHGKMSSRAGSVVQGDWLMDEVRDRIMNTYGSDKDTAEKIALAAVKYSMLKVHKTGDIAFDIDESVAMQGDSGPYLLYTYARTHGVLAKAGWYDTEGLEAGDLDLQDEEHALLKDLARFPHVVEQAAKDFAPNYLADFLFDLSRKFNLFYQKQPIIEADADDLRRFRLALTETTGEVIKRGLDLLGIEALEKM